MDKSATLCEKDEALLREFSRRVVRRVTGRAVPLRLPFISSYIDANVLKEVEKDRIVIRRASEAFEAGTSAGDMDGDALFEETKAVDRTFVKNLRIPAFSLTMRYGDFADIRKKRIRLLVEAVYTVLREWNDAATLEEALRAACPVGQFRETLTEILHLYNLETRILSRSVRFLPPFHGVMAKFADVVFNTMEAESRDLVDDYANRIYGGAHAHVPA
jgi:hypothetical protein